MTLGALIFNWLNQVDTKIVAHQVKWIRQFNALRNHFNHSDFYEQYEISNEENIKDSFDHLEVLKIHTRDFINILRSIIYQYEKRLITTSKGKWLKVKGKFYNDELFRSHFTSVRLKSP